MTTGLSTFFKHNLWANLKLLNACAQLTDEQLDFTATGHYGSIRETLLHIFSAEERYARDCGLAIEDDPLSESAPFPSFDTLKQRAERTSTHLMTVAEEADVSEVLHLDNGNYDAPIIIVLLQAINHGVDHRSQIATLMSLQGVSPPRMDGWGYHNEISS